MSFFFHLTSASLKASMNRRGAFLLETAFMTANNLIFFFIWWIFFRQFEDVSGWNFHDMTVLMAIGLGSYGLMGIFFGGMRNLSRTIVNGDLDSFLTKPKNVLLHVAGSRSLTKAWGHFMSAIILIVLGGLTAPKTIALIVVSMLCGCAVFTSFNCIVQSMAFWTGPIENLSKKFCDALFLFSLYPTNIYSGFLQLVMFTLIPAGVISYLPVEMVRSFCWLKFFSMIASSLVFVSLAFWIFHQGLKRYVSGNL